MSTHISATELRKMQEDELRKEIERHKLDVAKMRLSVGMKTQKDTAQFRRNKREIARMLTVLGQVQKGEKTELKVKHTTSTVSAPARSRTAKQSSTSR